MRPARLELPGDTYYPESVTIDADGNLFVGSIATGQITRIAGDGTLSIHHPGGDPKGVTGLHADGASRTLFACGVEVDRFLQGELPGTEVRAYDLATGAPRGTYMFPAPAFCNDFAQDASGNLYVTDSFGRIYRLAAGASELAVWSDDPLLAPSSPSGFGVDGIAIDGAGSVYANTFTDGKLLRIPVQPDGSAGPAVELTVAPALQGPDAMRVIAPDTLVVVNGNSGELVEVAIAGTAATSRVVASGLLMPTSVAVDGASYWVSEGQIGVLLGVVPGPPSLPFVVKRVDP